MDRNFFMDENILKFEKPKKIMKKKTKFILALNFYFLKTNITSNKPLKKFKPCKFNNLNFYGDNTSNNYGCSSCCFHVVVVCTKETLMKERGLTKVFRTQKLANVWSLWL
jgi:hypothetical protein